MGVPPKMQPMLVTFTKYNTGLHYTHGCATWTEPKKKCKIGKIFNVIPNEIQ